MQEPSTEEDPQRRFQAAVQRRMDSSKVDPSLVSKATKIPESRLRTIMGSEPGVALLSDMIALAAFFEMSLDSFFT